MINILFPTFEYFFALLKYSLASMRFQSKNYLEAEISLL